MPLSEMGTSKMAVNDAVHDPDCYNSGVDGIPEDGLDLSELNRLIDSCPHASHHVPFVCRYSIEGQTLYYAAHQMQSSAEAGQTKAQENRSISRTSRDVTYIYQTFAQQRQHIAENHQSITKQHQSIAKQKQSMAEKNQMIAQKNQTIARENQMLAQENQAIAQGNQKIAEENQKIAQENQTIAQENKLFARPTLPIPKSTIDLDDESTIYSDDEWTSDSDDGSAIDSDSQPVIGSNGKSTIKPNLQSGIKYLQRFLRKFGFASVLVILMPLLIEHNAPVVPLLPAIGGISVLLLSDMSATGTSTFRLFLRVLFFMIFIRLYISSYKALHELDVLSKRLSLHKPYQNANYPRLCRKYQNFSEEFPSIYNLLNRIWLGDYVERDWWERHHQLLLEKKPF